MNDRLEQEFLSFFTMDCPNCEESVSGNVLVPEPDFYAAEDLSDLFSEGQGEIQCPNCDSVFSCYVFFTHGECTITLNDYPDTHVSVDPPYYWPPEEWILEEPPKDPCGVFWETAVQTEGILKDSNEVDGGSLINRMCFSQMVSAFEAYIADTLINSINEDEEKLGKLVSVDRDLREQKLTLYDLIKEENALHQRVNRHLRSLLYHNIPRINPLYSGVLGFPVFSDKEDLSRMMSIVSDRHDCVHRNGRTPEGDAPEKYSVGFVLEVVEFLREAVNRIEKEIRRAKMEIFA